MKNFVFFGTSRFSVVLLEELKSEFKILPILIVTQPDKPTGRKQIITPPEVKVWALKNKIEVFQPKDLKDTETLEKLRNYDFFVVASYGKIIPLSILELPKNGTLNVHPSLLPKYRGASPIQSQILNGEENIGITIMLMDKEMDHGNIISQKKISFRNKFIGNYEEVEEKLAIESSILLSKVMENWPIEENGSIEQKHELATFTKMIKKADGLIDINDDPELNYRKYLAYHHWPKVYFYNEIDSIKKRNIVTLAEFVDGKFKILKIIPEGKKETNYIPAV